MLRSNTFFFIILIFTLFTLACNKVEPVCPDSQAFDFKLTLVRVKDITSTSLRFYNSQGSIVAKDSLPTLLSVPVDITSDSTTFFIDFINDTLPTITDTIAFTYTSNIYMHDIVCGFIMDFEIDSIYSTFNQIDSAFWVNKLINMDNASNLEIYY